MKQILICIDGSNCAGKSTLRQLLLHSLRDIGLLVGSISDEEVQSCLNLKKNYHSSHGLVRSNLRERLWSSGLDVVIQERSIVSHFVFDHSPPGNSIRRSCCMSYDEVPDIAVVLNVPAHILLKRYLDRTNFTVAMSFHQQEQAFQRAAKSLGLPILRNIVPMDLNRAAQKICIQIRRLCDE